ncbi:protease Lon-related BREX system protein BrxL [Paenibacillus sanguinis]|uniref:protease Lon-related BREX system protein BrxL n=1 Tax=Paenibacillus sanguinis TaxID=225906 RepID=UPI00037902C2|nr:protease Lon-related BREX system protein BrxL [Paenibacillus sanguinis]
MNEISGRLEGESGLIDKLNTYFAGKIVRKDLTKKIKEGANVPVYVLEYLLGMYCSSMDEEEIEAGVRNVKSILAENYVRPDEAQKIISKLREKGSYTVIDKVSVKLNYKNDVYEAEFSNLGIGNVPIGEKYVSQYERLLAGGIWCIVQMEYFYDEADKNRCPFIIRKLDPIQMPSLDLEEVKAARSYFTDEEWIDVLLRSTGMEPSQFTKRVKWLHLARLVPMIENNYNLCELGPRSTGKSHIYKEISPNSILVSGGQTTVANLFYNMGNKTVGLVGLWDCVAFDEVAGIKFKDQDGIQIMKDYMASGSFARGKEEKNAYASMTFVGNINQSVDVILKTSHLFDPFPAAMANDTAFLDRMHCYIPGWEIPKYRPEFFTNAYGFITDYFAEMMRELRKISYGDAFDKYFKLGNNLNQRDVIAVRKTVSGLIKLVHPDGRFTKENVEEILRFALEMRRRVKEQLKKIGGMEFYDVNFSYIDQETFNEEYVSVPEQGGGKLIPEGMNKPGHVYTVSHGKSGMIGVYKLETQMTAGTGKFEKTGIGSDREAREAVDTAYRYLKANGRNISGLLSTTTKDYLMHVQDLNGIGMTKYLTLPAVVAICSVALNKPILSSTVILGDLCIGGTIIKVEELANTLQVCLDSGAKKVLVPITSAVDLGTVPSELIGCFNIIFYQTAEDAVFKALGVE